MKVGKELFYENVSEEIANRYAGGMIWARDISAAYPDEGVRLPYHRYLDEPDRLAEIALFPENPLICKYGSSTLPTTRPSASLSSFSRRSGSCATSGTKARTGTPARPGS